MKRALLVACALLLPLSAQAFANEGGETYRRQRMHGGRHGFGGRQHFGYPWYGGFYQPQFVGSWYQRPYPYHFDYFRWKYSAPPAMPPVDYPCADGFEPVPVQP